MKSGKNTIKRGGAVTNRYSRFIKDFFNGTIDFPDQNDSAVEEILEEVNHNKLLGGSKRKSRKAKKTKKRRGSPEGGKNKCSEHCHRKTRRTKKRLKHHKN